MPTYKKPNRTARALAASRPSAVSLPGPERAWDFIRRCFDIRDKDLNSIGQRTLERFRKQEEISDRLTGRVQAEVERVLWEQRLPVSGRDGSPVHTIAREIVERLLETYFSIQRGLDLEGVDPHTGLLVVAEQVLVPLLAEAVASVTIEVEDVVWCRPWIIGDEFRGEHFGYLPLLEEGVLRNPLPRVLEHWLRAGGLNKGYGLGQYFKEKNEAKTSNSTKGRHGSVKDFPDGSKLEAPKKRFERYLRGTKPTSLLELHNYVDQVGRVDWLGGPADWKARFTLAWAIQTAGEELDRIFSAQPHSPALHFAEVYRKAARFALKYVDYGPVSFVARLVENDLRKRDVFKTCPTCRKLRRHLTGRYHGGASLEDVVERTAVRLCLLSVARKQGVLSEDCISPLFPLEGEEPRKNFKLAWDLVLPLDKAMPKGTFNRFCQFALPIGLNLLKREIAEATKGRTA